MKLSTFKNHLGESKTLTFMLPEGVLIPSHFHITEIGLVTKQFIDCGGTIRNEKTISFQLWTSTDTDHQLETSKLLGIIRKYEEVINHDDLEIEFEYQHETINKYGLNFNNGYFILTNTKTACLAEDVCGITNLTSTTKNLGTASMVTNQDSCCAPNSGCCR